MENIYDKCKICDKSYTYKTGRRVEKYHIGSITSPTGVKTQFGYWQVLDVCNECVPIALIRTSVNLLA